MRSAFASHVAEPVLEGFVLPALGRGERALRRLHVIQQGRLQTYVLYLLLALLVLFLWLLPIGSMIADLGAEGAFP